MDASPFNSCLQKQKLIAQAFLQCATPEAKYKKIIEMGKLLEPLALEHRRIENIVQGCQSILYLHTEFIEGNLYFNAYSEALISAGLASLLIVAYSGETPETILKCPPDFIKELSLDLALSPGRSNGLASMFFRMQQEAVKALSSCRNSNC